MILLLGGVAETAAIAESLAAVGCRVLVSTATDIPLNVGCSPGIEHCHGCLTEEDMTALIREKNILAVADATHPYAAQAHVTARRAAAAAGVYYATFIRPGTLPIDDGVQWAASHTDAAVEAFKIARPVLLTIGVRNLEPYARESARTGIAAFARVLPYPESLKICRQVGIPDDRIIAGRGPFSVEDNIRQIREHGIGVLVTKDSGASGGVPEKMEAARREGCRVLAVARPPQSEDNAFTDIVALTDAVAQAMQRTGKRFGE